MSNSVNPDQTALELIWVNTACTSLSFIIFRVNTDVIGIKQLKVKDFSQRKIEKAYYCKFGNFSQGFIFAKLSLCRLLIYIYHAHVTNF